MVNAFIRFRYSVIYSATFATAVIILPLLPFFVNPLINFSTDFSARRPSIFYGSTGPRFLQTSQQKRRNATSSFFFLFYSSDKDFFSGRLKRIELNPFAGF